jgi:putative nucleotidyltransferase with HDIG domain
MDLESALRAVPLRGRLRGYRVELYAGALALLTAALATSVAVDGFAISDHLWEVGLLAAFALWAERQHVRVTPNAEMTVSVLPVLLAAVLYGPLAGMIVGAVAVSGDFRRPYARWVIWTSMRSIAGGVAGLCAFLVLEQGEGFGYLLLAVTVAAVADAVIDSTLAASTVTVRGSGSWLGFMRSVQPIIIATVPLYTPIIAVLAYAHQEVSSWSVLLFFGPAFAAQRFYRLYQEEREATQQLTDANEALERAGLSFASALVAALDARDRYTAGHSAAVAVYARDIAERLGLPQRDQELVYLAGLVHDIGKVGLPPGLLEKPGALTLEERKVMEEHPVIGERILAKVEGYLEIARIVRHHHEHVDGHGYPDRLTKSEIPLLSRIISVADAYNAMTSGRPYREAMPSRVARLRLAQAVESQFDTTVVAAFEAILAGAADSYLSEVRPDLGLEAEPKPIPELVTTAA